MKRTELARATPLRPGKPLRTLRTIKGRPIRVKGVIDDGDRWRLLRILVWTRDNGQCVACGQGVVATFECHHRRLRSQGGPDSPENLITLCSRCHRRAHHNRNWARTLGYILHAGDDPTTPVLDAAGNGWLLRADGTREQVPE